MPEIRWVNTKKKRSSPRLESISVTEFSSNPESQSSRILIANANNGVKAIFLFSVKFGLKSAKNIVFCILCMPKGGGGTAVFPATLSPWIRY